MARLAVKTEIISEELKKAMDEHVNKVYLISKENYCPVDKGNLKASAKKTILKDTPTNYTQRISFGGDASSYAQAEGSLFFWGTGELLMTARIYVDYALMVHEILEYQHNNPPTACAKYLERAVNETKGDLMQTIQIITGLKTVIGGRRFRLSTY
jgi:hypothetical protein